MQKNYQFSKQDQIEPTGTQVKEDGNTSIQGDDPSFEAIMKGMESFCLGCGFELNGSGIGRIPPAE